VGAVAIGGCGVASSVDPVAKAAEVTSKVPGYRVSAVVTVSSPAGGAVHTTLSGVIDRVTRAGAMTANENIAGHAFTVSERLSGLTV
jgi:hypothetical protein